MVIQEKGIRQMAKTIRFQLPTYRETVIKTRRPRPDATRIHYADKGGDYNRASFKREAKRELHATWSGRA